VVLVQEALQAVLYQLLWGPVVLLAQVVPFQLPLVRVDLHQEPVVPLLLLLERLPRGTLLVEPLL
jgi:hypothetical protein